MVAYNFQKQFVEPIQSGEKTHTIRKNGNRRHAKPGEPMQIYFGLRTKYARKIIDDPTCLFVSVIEIEVTEDRIAGIWIDGEGVPGDMNDFAVSDGFADIAAMHKFWLDFHGVGLFRGSMIGWGNE